MFKSPSAIGPARPFAAAVLAAYAIGAVAAHASVIVLPGSADIFLAGQTSVPAQGSEGSYFPQQTAAPGNGVGTLPDEVVLTSSEIANGITVSATGTVSCGVGCTPVGPNGDAEFITPPGSMKTTDGPFTVASYTGTTSMVLVGAWGGSDPSLAAFFIGAGPIVLRPPSGDDILYLGFVDSFGGSPYAGTYNDNTGDLDVSITSIPEPASWALMALGFVGLGFAGYRRTRAPALV